MDRDLSEICVSSCTNVSSVRFIRQRVGRFLRTIVWRHLYHAGQRVDYSSHQVQLKFYVDLMEASIEPGELDIMATALAIFLRDIIRYPYQVIAVPKEGNPLLGQAVARRLRKKLLLIKDHDSPHRTYKLDGTFDKADKAVLVDDVSSDGNLLARSVEILRNYKVCVDDCATIVHRLEGPAPTRLGGCQCAFHSMISLSDPQIKRLIGLKTLPA